MLPFYCPLDATRSGRGSIREILIPLFPGIDPGCTFNSRHADVITCLLSARKGEYEWRKRVDPLPPSSTDRAARWPPTCCCSEKYPSFRAAQMRLEGATSRRREAGQDLKEAKVVTIKTIVHVVYNTAEQNVSDAQINSQFKAMNKDFRATNPDKSQTPTALEGPRRRLAHRVQAGQGDADQDDEDRLSRSTTASRKPRPAESRRSPRRPI